jgi:RNA polymerase sigma factor (sigma-70 family)
MGELTADLGRHQAPTRRVAPGLLRLLDDDRLVRLAARGNPHAFAAIYERFHQELYRYCRSILRDSDEALDALQNTMVSALGSLPGERRRIKLRPWLFRIAHNEAISLLRRRDPSVPIEEASGVPFGDELDPATRDRLRILLEDLAELPERQRGALLMRELNGLGYPEIGAALGTSEGAAKEAVYAARVALQALEEGREMECDAVRRSISARDGRVLRGRRLRAHLRGCRDCRAFRNGVEARRASLAALAPPLPAAMGVSILNGVLGGGSAASGASATALVGGGQAVAASASTKALAAGLATVAVGAGTIELADRLADRGRGKASPSAASGGPSAMPGASQFETPAARLSSVEGSGARVRPGHDQGRARAVKKARGDVAPGLGGDQGPVGAPPGRGGSPAGRDGTPPELSAPPAGLAEPPPGQVGGTPGFGGAVPGRSTTPPGQAEQ